jgi:hypothetical protein
MRFISHRGNISSRAIKEENHPEKILYCLHSGYDVEIDVWYINNEYFLGHDFPEHKINKTFLSDKKLWCHAKNLSSLKNMLELQYVNCFWHQNDDFTITSGGYIWTYPGLELTQNSICVLPELKSYSAFQLQHCYGICSDNIEYYKKVLTSE